MLGVRQIKEKGVLLAEGNLLEVTILPAAWR
jgi:hypothetical protein